MKAAAPARLEIATAAVPLLALDQRWAISRSDVRTVFTMEP